MKGVRSGGGRVSVLKNKLLKRTIRGRMSWRATCVNWNFILFLISLLPFHFVLLFTLSSWVSIFITHTHTGVNLSRWTCYCSRSSLSFLCTNWDIVGGVYFDTKAFQQSKQEAVLSAPLFDQHIQEHMFLFFFTTLNYMFDRCVFLNTLYSKKCTTVTSIIRIWFKWKLE